MWLSPGEPRTILKLIIQNHHLRPLSGGKFLTYESIVVESTNADKMVFEPKQDAYVLEVGLIEFLKPRRIRDYVELGFEAGVKAIKNAQINYDDVKMGVACYCYGETTQGQRIFY